MHIPHLRGTAFGLAAASLLIFAMSGAASAHCDRLNGPVANAAREALETGNFAEVEIWVTEDEAPALREEFDRAVDVYRMGGKPMALAESHFISESIRLHRAAEGMPFTGVKPARPPAPDIAAAETALESGDIEPVIERLTKKMETVVTESFEAAKAASANKEESVEAGREWVDAYVRYIVFVHGINQKIERGPAHGVGGEDSC